MLRTMNWATMLRSWLSQKSSKSLQIWQVVFKLVRCMKFVKSLHERAFMVFCIYFKCFVNTCEPFFCQCFQWSSVLMVYRLALMWTGGKILSLFWTCVTKLEINYEWENFKSNMRLLGDSTVGFENTTKEAAEIQNYFVSMTTFTKGVMIKVWVICNL